MGPTRIRPFWYRIDLKGAYHAYDPEAKTTLCGVPVKASRLGRSNAKSTPSMRCAGCRLVISNG